MARSETRVLRVLAFGAGLSAAGCSLVVGGDRYVGTGLDGSVDAPLDPNAPSTPEITLSPDPATSADELVAMIVTPSVDPLGGTVTYEYRWLENGTPIAGQSDDTLPASVTDKGEVIRVEVTAVADGRRSAAQIAEVTIGNSPAVLTTIGLDRYDPRVGDRIRAIPGRVVDADGDPTSTRLQWYRGEEPIPGATGGSLDTAALGLAAGEEVSVEGYAFDGEEGPVVRLGPFELAAPGNHWRQLLDFDLSDGVAATTIFDAPHRRAVQLINGRAWEIVFETGQPLRVVRLPNLGMPPESTRGSMVFHDEANRRVVVVTTDDTSTIYSLDLTSRGREVWTRSSALGTAPTFIGSATTYDQAGERGWLFGGSGGGDLPFGNELWSLDLSQPGLETWKQHPWTSAPEPLFLPVLAMHPSDPTHLFIFGGGVVVGDSVEASTRVWDVTLDGDNATARDLGNVLPNPVLLAGAYGDARTNRIALVGGASAIGDSVLPSGIIVFDAALGTAAASGTLPRLLASGFLAPNPDGPGLFYGPIVGLENDDSHAHFGLFAIDPIQGTSTQLAIQLRPPSLSSAIALERDSTLTLAMGSTDYGDASSEIWRMQLMNEVWSNPEFLADAVELTGPAARFDIVAQSDYGRTDFTGLQLFGGSTNPSSLADTEVWEDYRGEGRWLHRTLAGGQIPPPARTGVALAMGACGADVMTIFGGQGSSGYLNDARTLVCDDASRMRNCRWQVAATGGVPPSPRAYSTLNRMQSSQLHLVFGGHLPVGASNELFAFDGCFGGTQPWRRPMILGGTAPAPRWGHTATLLPTEEGEGLESMMIFGGTNNDSRVTGSMFADVHRVTILDGSNVRWSRVDVPGESPSPRSFHAAIWDSSRRRLIVYGGIDERGDTLGDLWVLNLAPL